MYPRGLSAPPGFSSLPIGGSVWQPNNGLYGLPDATRGPSDWTAGPLTADPAVLGYSSLPHGRGLLGSPPVGTNTTTTTVYSYGGGCAPSISSSAGMNSRVARAPQSSQAQSDVRQLSRENDELRNNLAIYKDLIQTMQTAVAVKAQTATNTPVSTTAYQTRVPGIIPVPAGTVVPPQPYRVPQTNRGPMGPMAPRFDRDFAKQISPVHYFDGTQDVDLFLEQFQQRAHIFSWGEAEKVHALRLNLRGRALEFLRSLGPVAQTVPYDALATYLCQRFSKAPTAGAAQLQLQQVKQNDSESMDDFADRVRYLSSIAYGGYADERLATNHFLAGLRDRDLVSVVINRGEEALFQNLNYLVSTLRELVDKHKYVGSKPKSVRFASECDVVAQCQPSIINKVQDSNPAPASPRSSAQTPDLEVLLRPIQDFMGRMEDRFEKLSTASSKDPPETKDPIDILNARVDSIVSTMEKYMSTRSPRAGSGRGSCYECGSDSHYAARCPRRSSQGQRSRSPGASTPRSRSPGECYECGSRSHYANQCPDRQTSASRDNRRQSPAPQQQQNSPNYRGAGSQASTTRSRNN